MTKVVRTNFKVLNEIISPENVLEMAEILSLKETKWLTSYAGEFAVKVNHKLYSDVINKNNDGYVLSDSYDIVQTVAVFLCEHFGDHLDDYYCTTKKGKVVTIKIYCYRLINRVIGTKYRRLIRDISLEALTRKTEPRTELKAFEEDSQKAVDNTISQLGLNEYYETILNCRMAGMSFPEIGRIVGRQISTVWVALNKIKTIYINTIQ